MYVPSVINCNVLKTFGVKERYDPHNLKPESLKIICLQSIANNWTDLPDLSREEDRCILLDLLSTELPLKNTVERIKDNSYWKRCFMKRWPKYIPQDVGKNMFYNSTNMDEQTDIEQTSTNSENDTLSENCADLKGTRENFNTSRNWKRCYLEKHMQEFLENLCPEKYDAEEMKIQCDLCRLHVKTLNIRELQYSDISASRISLNAVLTGLPLLRDLSICFKQIYLGMNKFSMDVIKLPLQEIKSLTKGLEKCKLNKLRLINSDIDGEKCVIILKSMVRYRNLHSLDFSHCKIGDNGAIAVCKFALDATMEELFMPNNKIGIRGAEAIGYYLSHESCTLRVLNLRLNPLGQEGGNYILKSLGIIIGSLEILDLCGCGLNGNNSLIPEMISFNTTLSILTLSSNNLDNTMGELMLKALQMNSTLKKLDIRMCKISSELQQKIAEIMLYKQKLKSKISILTYFGHPVQNIEFCDGFKNKFDSILN